jgi:transposase
MKRIIQTNKRTGIKYVYEYESYWDKEKKQSRYKERKLIGHIDKDTGELTTNRPTKSSAANPASSRLFCGAAHLLESLSGQIGLDKDLDAAFPNISDAILSVAHYLLSEGNSTMARFARWSRTHVHPLSREMASQRLSELFETISQPGLEAFFKRRIKRAGGDYWFYDTTSISSYSQFMETVRWGRNKDRVPLPQLNVAAVLDARSGLPVYFKNIAGNISDVTMVRSLLADARQMGVGKMRLCLDRGFYSKANIDALMGEHMKFLAGLKTSYAYVGSAIAEHSYELRNWQNYDNDAHVFGMRIPHTWSYEHTIPSTGEKTVTSKRAYLHLYYLPERVVKDEEELAQLLSRLFDEIQRGNRKEEHEALYERYFKRVRGGGYVGCDDVIKAERERFGYFALLTNDATLTARGALAVYRNKDMIEKAFGDIKERLDFRTPKVENSETLRGKLCAVFVSLILASELRRRMDEAKLYGRYTMQGLLDELEAIERYECEGHRSRVLTVTKKQREIYEALNVEPLTMS